MELYNKLTTEGDLQEAWASFMFNMEDLKKMKMLQADLVLQLLLAGAEFLGIGWSPERARERLWQLSGCRLGKKKFEVYLHVWLLTIALVTGAQLPMLGLSQDGEAAAFALATAFDRQVEEPSQDQEQGPEQVWSRGDPNPLKENKGSLNNRLLALWHRAERGDHQVRKFPRQ